MIPNGETCNVIANGQVVEYTIDTMNVQSGGTLNIDAGITLILENDDDNIPSLGSDDHSKIDGTLNVGHATNGGGTLVVKAMNDPEHVFAGNGSMHGLNANCVIQVQEDKEFTNALATGGIINNFTIEATSGTATFNNEGRVMSDGAGQNAAVMVLESNLILTDIEDAIWGLDHCLSSMTFNRDSGSGSV